MTAGHATYPPRLRWLIVGVYALAAPIVAGAVLAIALEVPTPALLGQVLVFGLLAFLADLKPVPLDETGSRSVSLAFVFVLASQMLFGWEYGVVVGALCVLVPQLLERREINRTLFNSGVYAIAALTSALPGLVLDSTSTAHPMEIALYAFLGGALFVGTNVGLVCLAVAFFQDTPFRALLADNFRHSGMAFLTMVFLAPLAVVLWRSDSSLLLLLAGPLVTLTLYQHTALASRIAERNAHTDSLTGLGNHRAYELHLGNALEETADTGDPVTLCFIDVDGFKEINDAFGHPAGDAALESFARILDDAGPYARAFRIGGDEFAVVIDGTSGAAAASIGTMAVALEEHELPSGAHPTFSAGITTYPDHAASVEDLERVVDATLYWAKAHGKDRVAVYDPAIVRLRTPAEQLRQAERASRLRAAESLIRIVDAKDTYTGRHSQSVAELCRLLAIELELEEEAVDLVRLAGLLHDLGKILIPDEVLRKPSRLDAEETELVRGHPELGYSLLQSLDIAPVDTWVRHHHEHWDGSGYPHGLTQEGIPLGSRILLVADAFDAITTERSYRPAASPECALEELRAKAGLQFDPSVVEALGRCLGLAAGAVVVTHTPDLLVA